jgi:hypothetical protein
MAAGTPVVNASNAMPVTCSGDAATLTVSTYYATSNPVTAGGTGSRYFWTNTLGTIYQNLTAPIAVTLGNAPPGVGTPIQ